MAKRYRHYVDHSQWPRRLPGWACAKGAKGEGEREREGEGGEGFLLKYTKSNNIEGWGGGEEEREAMQWVYRTHGEFKRGGEHGRGTSSKFVHHPTFAD